MAQTELLQADSVAVLSDLHLGAPSNVLDVAPAEITTRHMYVGIIPFVLIQLVALVVLWFAPGLATALPRKLYGG